MFLVDDHLFVRHSLQLILEAESDIVVIGEAALGREAVAVIPQQEVDVVVCDYDLPDIDGLQVTHSLLRANKGLKILIFSAIDHGLIPRHLIGAGALGYVTKGGADGAKFVRAIREVAAGRRYWDEVIGVTSLPGKTPFDRLPMRELQVANLTIRRLSITAVAEITGLTESSVRTYRQRLFKKLGVRSDVDLLYLAREHGLIPPD
ncbi:response regulator transcription factor [Lysobacter sp. ISL-50]|uniref:response regulator transcription factor n=1 Tax=unclassified Lysobacter TaxID=2635362 RepID=UPI0031BB61F3